METLQKDTVFGHCPNDNAKDKYSTKTNTMLTVITKTMTTKIMTTALEKIVTKTTATETMTMKTTTRKTSTIAKLGEGLPDGQF